MTADTARPVTVDLTIEDERWHGLLATAADGDLADRLAALTARTITTAGADDAGRPSEVAVVLSDDRRLRQLNRDYRGVDRPTNVLSFPLDPDGSPPPPDAPRLLGDVLVAYETVAAEAAAEGKTVLDHLSHLVVHGVLHLLGHDHDEPAQADRMEALEVTILAGAGIADPYETTGAGPADR